MGFLDKLFGRKAPASATEAETAAECVHASLVPRWESAADIGKTEMVSTYTCEACKQTFPRTVGEAILAAAAERLRVRETEGLAESEHE
jgi:hypothetical protein